jgi:hypothetical protein
MANRALRSGPRAMPLCSAGGSPVRRPTSTRRSSPNYAARRRLLLVCGCAPRVFRDLQGKPRAANREPAFHPD